MHPLISCSPHPGSLVASSSSLVYSELTFYTVHSTGTFEAGSLHHLSQMFESWLIRHVFRMHAFRPKVRSCGNYFLGIHCGDVALQAIALPEILFESGTISSSQIVICADLSQQHKQTYIGSAVMWHLTSVQSRYAFRVSDRNDARVIARARRVASLHRIGEHGLSFDRWAGNPIWIPISVDINCDESNRILATKRLG